MLDFLPVENESALRQRDATTLRTIRQERAMLHEVQTSAWFVLTDNPEDYSDLLEEGIRELLLAARTETDFKRGVQRAMQDRRWIDWNQFERDVRQCNPAFNEQTEDGWKRKYEIALDEILKRLG